MLKNLSGNPSRGDQSQPDQRDGELLNRPGAIQQFGVLLCLDTQLQRVTHVSANVAELFKRSAERCLGEGAETLLGKSLLARIRRGLEECDQLPGALTATRRFAGESVRLHVAAYRSGGCVVVELEPMDSGTRYRWLSLVNDWLGKVVQTRTQDELIDKLAEAVRAITGFDRALVTLFDEHWNAQVLAQSRNEVLPSLRERRFPAWDTPPEVRALYESNRLRFVADSGADPVPLLASPSQACCMDVDLTHGTLRAPSNDRRVYLRGMGVSASLSIAIYSDAGLWGLVSCHNAEPMVLSASARDSATTLVQVASQRLFLLKAEAETHYRQRIYESRVLLARSVQERRAPRDLLYAYSDSWRQLFNARGVALVYLGEITLEGETPDEEGVRRLANWLEHQVPEAEPWSSASLAKSGFPDADLLGESCCGLLATPLLIDMDARGWLLMFREKTVETLRWFGRSRPGVDDSVSSWEERVQGCSKAWVAAELSAVRDLGDDLAVIASAHEVARLNEYLRRERRALAEANRHLEQVANTDSLTGIMNRYRIEHLVQLALANAERYRHTFSLLLFDIDYFKRINDNHGHETGDRILKSLVQKLESGLRDSDQMGRWGGEEFLVLVPNTPLADAGVFAERLCSLVSQTDFGLPEPVTISIGVAEWAQSDSLRKLIARADQAMYQAKNSGRNRVCLEVRQDLEV